MTRSLARLIPALLAFAGISLFAAEHPARQIQIKYKDSIVVPPGGSTPLDISLTIPANYHVYLKHATATGNAILTQISIPAQSGFQLREVKRPEGKKESDEMVLRGAGTFSVVVMDLAKQKSDTTTTVPLQIKVQICKDDPMLCYLPITIEKTLTVQKRGTPFSSRASTSNLVKWVTSYDQAIAQAKARKLNIFALLSNPATCGACEYLDSETLSKKDVAEFLNKKFVPYNVPRGDYGRFVSGSFGIPLYFALSPDGKKLETFEGAPSTAGFLSGLKPFAGTEAENVTPPNTTPNALRIELYNGNQKCSIDLKRSYAYQAAQNGEFQNNGNIRIVANSSNPGTYTLLQIGRTAEIDGSFSAKVSNGKLVVERYLARDNLELTCSTDGLSGTIAAANVEVNILTKK